MKAIRRSLKGDKDPRPQQLPHHQHHASLPTKSAVAILPPKKVIRALYDYAPDPANPHELAFNKGDFFHVISREEDSDWYEACNPLSAHLRGLVPVSFFEVLGKTERLSADNDDHHHHHHRTLHDDLHDSGFSDRTADPASSTNTTKQGAQRMSSIGKTSGAMVYGVVQYDFHAERPDELEARAGEAIIVIAQSNPEWFVAKPIGRLGGPGLIPVSFIEVRDMTTGQPVADPHDAVKRAGVPRVEEWKKMTAEYKNSSITLGKFEGGGVQSATSEIERMSLNNSGHQNSNDYYHQRSMSKGQNQRYPSGQQHLPPQQRQQGYYSVPAPIKASIPRYCFDNDKYWYIIEAQMEDGRWWELARYYHDFYDFQIALLAQFEEEAGNKGSPRTLPFMPGPVTHVTNAISNGRRQNLDEYIKKLLSMPPHISRCQLVRQLFAPRAGDFEIDPNAVADDYRLSTGSQLSSGHDLSPSASRQSSQGQMNSATTAVYPHHQRSQGSVSQSSMTRGDFPPPKMMRQGSALTQSSVSSNNNNPAAGANAVKIKVVFRDDLIVVRVPADIALAQLKEKIRDRLKVDEDVMLRYKDEPSRGFVELLGDADLDVAMQRNQKLMVYVGLM
ncbi:bud emergence protein 1 [Ophidiomyces ophidiicola]|nr:bud emergence protein 1 [Ophidiomyces ophidiicola]KAI1919626.1 bud emergence protein 1 [Ophidiomyces ophidiicola]KAI1927132.1 bud emergence protein 1 [Ophidiomyces ophidiicola]KAI2002229.1 bud emergence protein 1 [Ophidiomyces ophidiicola]KAI2013598.1 bud emergence protein 1 [Ophidiomyces ophidiicola]